jgi:hypothetical protein
LGTSAGELTSDPQSCLRARRLLLVLDNCRTAAEQRADASVNLFVERACAPARASS